jgi:hypothetical protein
VVNNLQKHIEELKVQTMKMDVADPSGSATPNSTLNKKPDYQIDEEDLAKETEWIRVKHGAKKRKIAADLYEKNTAQTEYETKRELAPPPIMMDGVKPYESLYDELTKQIPKESFLVKVTHEETAKIN